jgi:hypothetical protein
VVSFSQTESVNTHTNELPAFRMPMRLSIKKAEKQVLADACVFPEGVILTHFASKSRELLGWNGT